MILGNGRDASRLPFEGYKWRWASVQPTEGLNDPAVFVGVLRVLAQREGEAPSSPAVFDALRELQGRVETNVQLARPADRNLIRNAGQYWKVPGLLADIPGEIHLTPFGRDYAWGRITSTGFATRFVNSLRLPSPAYSPADTALWDAHGLSIYPLRLILQVAERVGYLTEFEFFRCVIPLAGQDATIDEHAQLIRRVRAGQIDVSGWGTSLVGANDHRFAREFLRFLEHYGFLEARSDGAEKRWVLSADAAVALGPVIDATAPLPDAESDRVSEGIERVRTMREVLARPQQARFRKNVLEASGRTCLLTGTSHPSVLEAAHIRPVSHRGSDTASNGLCLRSDIHALFDGGHIRIHPDGTIHLSDALSADPAYAALPSAVTLPGHVAVAQLQWRWDFL